MQSAPGVHLAAQRDLLEKQFFQREGGQVFDGGRGMQISALALQLHRLDRSIDQPSGEFDAVVDGIGVARRRSARRQPVHFRGVERRRV